MRAVEWSGKLGAGEVALPAAAVHEGRGDRALLAGLALAVFAALVLAGVASSVRGTNPQPSHQRLSGTSTVRIPETLTATASVSFGSSERSFWAVRDGGSLLAAGGGIQGVFSASSARLRVARGTLSLSNPVLERAGLAQRLKMSAPAAVRNEIVYRHGPLTEFYRNGPYGLEQAFVLTRRPLAGGGPLIVAMRLGGSLTPRRAGSQILLRTPGGATALRYGQLSVRDATGRLLPARLQIHRGTLQLRIADNGARYPLRVDPFVQQGEKLTAGEELGAGQFGKEVALSADGNTALIGGPNDNGSVGAAWVFTRSGTTWTQQGPKLTGTGELGTGLFGSGVALSADGNTALIGGPGDNHEVGATWVFTRSGSTWTQQAELTGTGSTGRTQFGFRVALSADGNTALIGGPGDSAFQGAAWVFTQSEGAWTQQGSKLTGGGATTEAEFGAGVALSSDGNTALIGGSGDATFTGAAWVFTRSEETWTQQGAKLTGSGEVGSGRLGFRVALSETGDTALLGAGSDASEVGAAFVFVRSGATWTQQGSKLTGGGEVGKGHFGFAVSLAGDGNTALVGGVADNAEVGAAWVFGRSGSTWGQQGAKLTGGGETGKGLFGSSVALSSDDSTAIIGGSRDNASVGAAWAFGAAPPAFPTVTTQPASSLTLSSAVLNATVNPNGATVTDCHFEYGLSTSYTSSVPCSKLPGAGVNPVAVSAQVTGLSRNTEYHFRIVATNGGGTGEGADQVFTTLNPPEFGRCVKVPAGVKGQYTTAKCTSPATAEKFSFNWEPGPGPKPQFTMKIKATTVATLEMAGAKKMVCTGQTSAGEYSGLKTIANVTLTLTGCELEGAKCTSASAAEGEVVSTPLEGAIGIEKTSTEGPLKDKVAMDLLPVGGTGPVMEFSCGLSAVSVSGSVLVPVKTNAMLATATLKYTSTADKQKPESFEAQPVDVLETSLNEGPFARAGLKLTTVLTNKEKLETNTIA
jgi:hypothetical protein